MFIPEKARENCKGKTKAPLKIVQSTVQHNNGTQSNSGSFSFLSKVQMY